MLWDRREAAEPGNRRVYPKGCGIVCDNIHHVIDPGRLTAFFFICTTLIVIPGPSVVFVVSRGVALGRRAGIATAIGNETGLLVQVVIVTLGLGALLQESTLLLSVIKLAGAVYLVFLGVQHFRHRTELASLVSASAEPKD